MVDGVIVNPYGLRMVKKSKTPKLAALRKSEPSETPPPVKAAPPKAAPPKAAPPKAEKTPETPADRGAACSHHIHELLAHYRCQLVATIAPPEAIGPEPAAKVMLSAEVRILALE